MSDQSQPRAGERVTLDYARSFHPLPLWYVGSKIAAGVAFAIGVAVDTPVAKYGDGFERDWPVHVAIVMITAFIIAIFLVASWLIRNSSRLAALDATAEDRHNGRAIRWKS